MEIEVAIPVAASPKAVWRIVSDIEHSGSVVTAIEEIVILEPAKGPSIKGLKWKETRTMFGKQASEVMWITDVKEGAWYKTRAESHGAVYQTKVAVTAHDGGARFSMTFTGTPVTRGAKVVWALTGFMVKSAMKKALAKDLEEIRAVAEGK